MLGAGARRNGAEKDLETASRHATPRYAAQLRVMAELAEAEAAEADALAAAANARARALRLRQQAQLAAPTAQDDTHAHVIVDDVAHDDRAIDGDADPASAAEVGDAAVSKPRWYRRRSGRRGFAVVAVSAAVIVILAALAGSTLIVVEHRHASAHRQRAAEFAAAARQGVVTLTSLDFHHSKQSVQRILDNSTGAFRDDFQKTADDFVKLLDNSKVVVRGSVRAVAVDWGSMTPDSAVVLVVSTSDVIDADGTKRDSRSFRLRVTVNRNGDQLKMTKVEFVS